jgi:hypothetical protein
VCGSTGQEVCHSDLADGRSCRAADVRAGCDLAEIAKVRVSPESSGTMSFVDPAIGIPTTRHFALQGLQSIKRNVLSFSSNRLEC